MVDFPLPEPPMSATRAPGATDRLKSVINGGASGLYPKVIDRRSRAPESRLAPLIAPAAGAYSSRTGSVG